MRDARHAASCYTLHVCKVDLCDLARYSWYFCYSRPRCQRRRSLSPSAARIEALRYECTAFRCCPHPAVLSPRATISSGLAILRTARLQTQSSMHSLRAMARDEFTASTAALSHSIRSANRASSIFLSSTLSAIRERRASSRRAAAWSSHTTRELHSL